MQISPTSFGMYRYYRHIPKCRFCKKVKLVRHFQRQVGCCSSCFKKMTNYKFDDINVIHSDKVKFIRKIIENCLMKNESKFIKNNRG